eukprot:GHVN01068647.1.p1 GENE.GHVN01068647.1~~GHVN01068647.1.p1  ORF type:complete len:2233 (-),score=488.60 GHVN01068647.1:53-5953(-)
MDEKQREKYRRDLGTINTMQLLLREALVALARGSLVVYKLSKGVNRELGRLRRAHRMSKRHGCGRGVVKGESAILSKRGVALAPPLKRFMVYTNFNQPLVDETICIADASKPTLPSLLPISDLSPRINKISSSSAEKVNKLCRDCDGRGVCVCGSYRDVTVERLFDMSYSKHIRLEASRQAQTAETRRKQQYTSYSQVDASGMTNRLNDDAWFTRNPDWRRADMSLSQDGCMFISFPVTVVESLNEGVNFTQKFGEVWRLDLLDCRKEVNKGDEPPMAKGGEAKWAGLEVEGGETAPPYPSTPGRRALACISSCPSTPGSSVMGDDDAQLRRSPSTAKVIRAQRRRQKFRQRVHAERVQAQREAIEGMDEASSENDKTVSSPAVKGWSGAVGAIEWASPVQWMQQCPRRVFHGRGSKRDLSVNRVIRLMWGSRAIRELRLWWSPSRGEEQQIAEEGRKDEKRDPLIRHSTDIMSVFSPSDFSELISLFSTPVERKETDEQTDSKVARAVDVIMKSEESGSDATHSEERHLHQQATLRPTRQLSDAGTDSENDAGGDSQSNSVSGSHGASPSVSHSPPQSVTGSADEEPEGESRVSLSLPLFETIDATPTVPLISTFAHSPLIVAHAKGRNIGTASVQSTDMPAPIINEQELPSLPTGTIWSGTQRDEMIQTEEHTGVSQLVSREIETVSVSGGQELARWSGIEDGVRASEVDSEARLSGAVTISADTGHVGDVGVKGDAGDVWNDGASSAFETVNHPLEHPLPAGLTNSSERADVRQEEAIEKAAEENEKNESSEKGEAGAGGEPAEGGRDAFCSLDLFSHLRFSTAASPINKDVDENEELNTTPSTTCAQTSPIDTVDDEDDNEDLHEGEDDVRGDGNDKHEGGCTLFDGAAAPSRSPGGVKRIPPSSQFTFTSDIETCSVITRTQFASTDIPTSENVSPKTQPPPATASNPPAASSSDPSASVPFASSPVSTISPPTISSLFASPPRLDSSCPPDPSPVLLSQSPQPSHSNDSKFLFRGLTSSSTSDAPSPNASPPPAPSLFPNLLFSSSTTEPLPFSARAVFSSCSSFRSTESPPSLTRFQPPAGSPFSRKRLSARSAHEVLKPSHESNQDTATLSAGWEAGGSRPAAPSPTSPTGTTVDWSAQFCSAPAPFVFGSAHSRSTPQPPKTYSNSPHPHTSVSQSSSSTSSHPVVPFTFGGSASSQADYRSGLKEKGPSFCHSPPWGVGDGQDTTKGYDMAEMPASQGVAFESADNVTFVLPRYVVETVPVLRLLRKHREGFDFKKRGSVSEDEEETTVVGESKQMEDEGWTNQADGSIHKGAIHIASRGVGDERRSYITDPQSIMNAPPQFPDAERSGPLGSSPEVIRLPDKSGPLRVLFAFVLHEARLDLSNVWGYEMLWNKGDRGVMGEPRNERQKSTEQEKTNTSTLSTQIDPAVENPQSTGVNDHIENNLNSIRTRHHIMLRSSPSVDFDGIWEPTTPPAQASDDRCAVIGVVLGAAERVTSEESGKAGVALGEGGGIGEQNGANVAFGGAHGGYKRATDHPCDFEEQCEGTESGSRTLEFPHTSTDTCATVTNVGGVASQICTSTQSQPHLEVPTDLPTSPSTKLTPATIIPSSFGSEGLTSQLSPQGGDINQVGQDPLINPSYSATQQAGATPEALGGETRVAEVNGATGAEVVDGEAETQPREDEGVWEVTRPGELQQRSVESTQGEIGEDRQESESPAGAPLLGDQSQHVGFVFTSGMSSEGAAYDEGEETTPAADTTVAVPSIMARSDRIRPRRILRGSRRGAVGAQFASPSGWSTAQGTLETTNQSQSGLITPSNLRLGETSAVNDNGYSRGNESGGVEATQSLIYHSQFSVPTVPDFKPEWFEHACEAAAVADRMCLKTVAQKIIPFALRSVTIKTSLAALEALRFSPRQATVLQFIAERKAAVAKVHGADAVAALFNVGNNTFGENVGEQEQL